jgi:hypothetical protein
MIDNKMLLPTLRQNPKFRLSISIPWTLLSEARGCEVALERAALADEVEWILDLLAAEPQGYAHRITLSYSRSPCLLRFATIPSVVTASDIFQVAAFRQSLQDSIEHGDGDANVLPHKPPFGDAFQCVHGVRMLSKVPQNRLGHLFFIRQAIHIVTPSLLSMCKDPANACRSACEHYLFAI